MYINTYVFIRTMSNKRKRMVLKLDDKLNIIGYLEKNESKTNNLLTKYDIRKFIKNNESKLLEFRESLDNKSNFLPLRSSVTK